MKALITGINGFAGSYLAQYLIQKNYKVFGLIQPKTDIKNLNDIKSKIKFVPIDLIDKPKVEKYISLVKPNKIFHLAGISSVKESADFAYKAFEVNFFGTLNIFEAVRKLKLKSRIILVSSAEVYGENLEKEVANEQTSCRPINHYASSKLCAETIALSYIKNEGIDAVIIRPGNHIGPRQSERFFVPTVAKQIAQIAAKKNPPVIYLGNLNVKRDFTDVRDIVKAYILVAEKGKTGGIYNVCSGKTILLKDIVKMFIEIAKVKVKIITKKSEYRKFEAKNFLLDCSKIKRTLNWRPDFSIEESILDIYNYYLDQVS